MWTGLAKWLPERSDDYNYWWLLTGRHLALMLQEAQYPIHQQYEILLFHYYIIIPKLGPRPSLTQSKPWKSFMTDDHSPIEYSWKWGLVGERSEVRYSVELIGPSAGTKLDPLNQIATKELLLQLTSVFPGLNLKWFDHFSQTLFPRTCDTTVDENADYSSSTFLAFEFLKKDIAVKAYFMPRNPSNFGNILSSSISEAIQMIGQQDLDFKSFAVLQDFLKHDQDGSILRMVMLAIDLVEPAQSRIKIYLRSNTISLAHVCAVMSLGGRKSVAAEAIEELRQLWYEIHASSTGLPPSTELPFQDHYTAGAIFHVDVQPGNPTPDIKFYFPVRHYSSSDLAVGQGLTRFLTQRGRGECADGYMKVLAELAGRHSLEENCGYQTYISCAFQKGQLAITSYLSPQVYSKT